MRFIKRPLVVSQPAATARAKPELASAQGPCLRQSLHLAWPDGAAHDRMPQCMHGSMVSLSRRPRVTAEARSSTATPASTSTPEAERRIVEGLRRLFAGMRAMRYCR